MENEENTDQEVLQTAIDNIFNKYDVNRNKHLDLNEVLKLMKDIDSMASAKHRRL